MNGPTINGATWQQVSAGIIAVATAALNLGVLVFHWGLGDEQIQAVILLIANVLSLIGMIAFSATVVPTEKVRRVMAHYNIPRSVYDEDPS